MDPSNANAKKNPRKRPASSALGLAVASASASVSADSPSSASGPNSQQHGSRMKQRKLAQQTPTYSAPKDNSPAQPNILRTVHPPRFAQSRAFELVALQSTLRRSLDLSKSRAFQKPPRYLRRRAASHNPRKVPRRLRLRAQRELENDPVTPKKRKPKALRRKPRSDYLARQERNGTWLETHLWMAKRFHMRPLWGYKIAHKPTQKGDRSTYRAAKYASVVHDASYQGVYEFVGPLEDVARLVQGVADPAGPRVGAARYTEGKRSVHVDLLDVQDPARPLLGPATAMWRPALEDGDPTAEAMDVDGPTPRTLWLWIHPATEVRLLACLAHVMDAQGVTSVHVTQLTDLCKLSLVGPKSFGLVHSTLKLAPTTPSAARTLWHALAGLTDPGALPPSTPLAIEVWDPRLTYPPPRPTYARTDDQRAQAHAALLSLATHVPPPSTIWSADARTSARASKPRDHALNARRHAHLVPGHRLTPDPTQDTSFPVLLLTTPTGGLDLVLPRGWSLPLWRSLVWAGARPAGLHCLRSLAHEMGRPYFPWDYPTTLAYSDVVVDEAREQGEKWARRPKAKRVNYDKLMVPAPFMPEWTALAPRAWLLPAALARRIAEVGHTEDGPKGARQALPEGKDWAAALVHVTLTFPGRGAVGEHALVYEMPAGQRERWMHVVREGTWEGASDVNAGAFVDPPAASEGPVEAEPRKAIGYVTSGRYALSEGRSKATAVVKLSEIVSKAGMGNKRGKEIWVLVRKTSGSVVYPAKVGWVHV